jgi:hypothetical protein
MFLLLLSPKIIRSSGIIIDQTWTLSIIIDNDIIIDYYRWLQLFGGRAHEYFGSSPDEKHVYTMHVYSIHVYSVHVDSVVRRGDDPG